MGYPLYHTALDTPDTGYFQANITSIRDARPIPGARVQISTESYPEEIIAETETDGNGQTERIDLPAPPLEYSMTPGADQPYANYNIRISAPDFETVEINGAEILSGETALQNTSLLPEEVSANLTEELFVVPAHTLYAEYPPKIPESETKTVEETGEIVLSRVVIPEYVVVHNGPPSDSSAKNYYVTYRDYILHKSNFPLFYKLSYLFSTPLHHLLHHYMADDNVCSTSSNSLNFSSSVVCTYLFIVISKVE